MSQKNGNFQRTFLLTNKDVWDLRASDAWKDERTKSLLQPKVNLPKISDESQSSEKKEHKKNIP